MTNAEYEPGIIYGLEQLFLDRAKTISGDTFDKPQQVVGDFMDLLDFLEKTNYDNELSLCLIGRQGNLYPRLNPETDIDIQASGPVDYDRVKEFLTYGMPADKISEALTFCVVDRGPIVYVIKKGQAGNVKSIKIAVRVEEHILPEYAFGHTRKLRIVEIGFPMEVDGTAVNPVVYYPLQQQVVFFDTDGNVRVSRVLEHDYDIISRLPPIEKMLVVLRSLNELQYYDAKSVEGDLTKLIQSVSDDIGFSELEASKTWFTQLAERFDANEWRKALGIFIDIFVINPDIVYRYLWGDCLEKIFPLMHGLLEYAQATDMHIKQLRSSINFSFVRGDEKSVTDKIDPFIPLLKSWIESDDRLRELYAWYIMNATAPDLSLFFLDISANALWYMIYSGKLQLKIDATIHVVKSRSLLNRFVDKN